MNERRKKPRKISAAVESRIEGIASRLGQIESQLKEEARRAREMESRVCSQITELQSQIARPESFIVLDESCAVDLEEWEKRIEEKYALLSAKESEMRKLEKDIYDRTERLLGEMRQRDLLLAAREEELKTLKQNVASGLNELQILMTKRARDTKPPRLVSFLADIGKKH